ncbi:hypothetical protein MEQU1_001846 [Malassezia equina]|uniref:Major facilitator superfamily (MFS) profile domain-containing protein n=1 Tax=Malassezia equina TaxID=1381935 RepID=A0AAF0ECP0_9BASI|nr:hypothetical protein MEQU1_001846 [Malassezia equina]
MRSSAPAPTETIAAKPVGGHAADVEVQHVEAFHAEKNKGNELEDDLNIHFSHVEASAVDEIYRRKVYIMNKIMNEHIGMTWWQYGLLLVSGVGWFLDNAWLQLVAVILSSAYNEFYPNQDSNRHEAFLNTALYVGLILGAAFWGYAADIVGRRFSFNATLFICGVFGVAAGGATSFVALASLLACTGFGIGGSLPVDGMLFLEFLPGARQQLLTLLSVFWPLGQLATSLIAWGFIPKWTCDGNNCDEMDSRGWRTHNVGWRYVLFTTGAYTLLCFIARFFIFRIPESPKFLISKGRDADAVVAMHKLAKMCGKPLPDGMLTVATLRSAAGQDVDMTEITGEETMPSTLKGRVQILYEDFVNNLTHSQSHNPFDHLKPLFSSRAMGYTTAVIWTLWALIGLAYPLFNAFIVLYLEGSDGDSTPVNTVYRNYVIVSVCGIPGSLLAAWLVDLPRSGRRGAMAFGTLLTGIFLFGFTGAGDSSDSQLAFSSVVSFTQNIMYGVLFCYTPETFPAPLRGAADGVGSSLNRVFGLFASIIYIYGGDNASAPIYVSATLFIVCALLMLTLRVETAARTAL